MSEELYPNLVDRFIRYVKVNTRSNEESTTVPSDPKEVAFLADLAEELKGLGLENVRTMADGYVFAELASNIDADVPAVGFISHVDTADFNAEGVNPQFVENYDGESDIKLNDDYTLSPADFPSLKKYKGHTLITTDGTTLLGADDKSGVAEIISAAEYLIAHPEVKHGKVVFGFGPDEEIGIGADNFHVKEFGADFAYTVDGGPLGELEWETFSAAAANIKIQGRNVHPGSAKDTMVNALQVAMDLHAALPAGDRPELTEGRQGFFHILKLNGTPEEAEMSYIIRDHDRIIFEERKQALRDIVEKMNGELGVERIKLDMYDQYYNMGEVLKDDMTSVDLAEAAMKALDIEPVIEPVRGGTDGSKITFLGLPTPNLFAGGENMHGRFEYVSTKVMHQAVDTILKIVELNAAK
ncbi:MULTISPECIES: peptidase T [Weissella]|uniref:Peptidase T n=1 Tax=Weissella fermenti TaxID=2987699 RepID=A0ABT6D707_9LACO|nr:MULTISPECIES: peptidase T [Weissella]KRN23141.1 peptidase T [Weissella confusa]MBD9095776.1 peptidase T [Weissella confusa]MBJ7621693.1 peptidase T [Weissella confusa]MBJ7623962.1 peptidase T [Weissella confusa]MBJ7641605.1 peptidase T [Weissella confusa]